MTAYVPGSITCTVPASWFGTYTRVRARLATGDRSAAPVCAYGPSAPAAPGPVLPAPAGVTAADAPAPEGSAVAAPPGPDAVTSVQAARAATTSTTAARTTA